MEGLDFRHVSLSVFIEFSGFRGNGLGESSGDIVHICHGVFEALPCMRVKGAMVMAIFVLLMVVMPVLVIVMVLVAVRMAMFSLVAVIVLVMISMPVQVIVKVLEGDRLNPIGRNDTCTAKTRSFQKAVDPTFEFETVYEEYIG